MSVRIASATSNTPVNTAVVTTTETVIFTVGPVNLVIDTATVLLFWEMVFTIGTGVTSCNFNLRRGSAVTATLINVTANVVAGAAGAIVRACGHYVDNFAGGAELQYSLCLKQNAATGNATIADGCMSAMVL